MAIKKKTVWVSSDGKEWGSKRKAESQEVDLGKKAGLLNFFSFLPPGLRILAVNACIRRCTTLKGLLS